MKTKIFCLLLSALLLAAALTGCTRRETQEDAEPFSIQPIATANPYEGLVEVDDGAGGTIWIHESDILTPFADEIIPEAVCVSDTGVVYNGTGWTLRRGVDVSAYQGEIDWQAVAASGVEFAMIRCGWRGYGAGSLNEDECYRANIEGALAAGLDVGVYFFSQATGSYEAVEEAVFTVQLLEGYSITLPVYFDWERQQTEDSRTLGTTADTVEECCQEFCRVVASAGYETGNYFNLNEAYNEYDPDQFAGLHIWIADPDAEHPRYYYAHDMWQYSFSGTVPGIQSAVDLDVLFVRTGTE